MACNAYAGIGFWSLNKLAKMEKSLMNSFYQHLPGGGGGIQKIQKRVTGALANLPATFLRIIKNNTKFQRKRGGCRPLLNPPLLLLNLCQSSFFTEKKLPESGSDENYKSFALWARCC